MFYEHVTRTIASAAVNAGIGGTERAIKTIGIQIVICEAQIGDLSNAVSYKKNEISEKKLDIKPTGLLARIFPPKKKVTYPNATLDHVQLQFMQDELWEAVTKLGVLKSALDILKKVKEGRMPDIDKEDS